MSAQERPGRLRLTDTDIARHRAAQAAQRARVTRGRRVALTLWTLAGAAFAFATIAPLVTR